MSSPISSSDVDYMRGCIDDLLPDTCSITSEQLAPDGMGGWTSTWGTVTGGSAIPCRCDAISGTEQIMGGALTPFHRWRFTLAHDAPVTTARRIVYSGKVYTIASVETSARSWQASVRVEADEL